MKDTTLCRGCRDDFYNRGNNPMGIQKCWMLKSAKRVKRWKLDWWTAPTVPGALVQIETYSCHHAPGKYALSAMLPACAVDPQYLAKPKRPARTAVEALPVYDGDCPF